MLHAIGVVEGVAGADVIDTITLDRHQRYRRRVVLTTDGGKPLLLELAHARRLRDGDALEIAGGGVVKVRAAAEELMEIHCHDALELARIAWHLGNRHTPVEITAGALYIEPDHVLKDMVEQLGAHVHSVRRPFEPEGGAYAHGDGHAHGGHAHEHEHGHEHEHSHDHEPKQGHSHGHSHGRRKASSG